MAFTPWQLIKNVQTSGKGSTKNVARGPIGLWKYNKMFLITKSNARSNSSDYRDSGQMVVVSQELSMVSMILDANLLA